MELTAETVGKFKVLKIGGRVDWECAGRLDAEIGRLIEGGSIFLAFDLDAVTLLSSGGIGALAFNTNLIRSRNGEVHIVSSNDYVNELFETLKLTLVFEGQMHRTLDEFKAAISKAESGSAE